MITIIGLGEKKNQITLMAKKAIADAACVVARTAKQAFGIKYHYTLDDIYLAAADFDDFNRKAANALLQLEKQYRDIVYAVSGDGFCDSSVEYLYSLGANVAHIAGAATIRPATTSFVYLSAYDLSLMPQLDNLPLMVHSIDSSITASEVKLYLLKFYSFDTPILFYDDKGAQKILLKDLDRQPKYGAFCKAFLGAQNLVNIGFCAVNPSPNADICRLKNVENEGENSLKELSFKPKNNNINIDSEFDKTVYTFGDLMRIMQRLTAVGGCPWDIDQTHQSIRSNMIEEAYEAVAAIDSGDTDNLIEELGDVMLQSVFHADIARRHGEFEFSDVITALCRKLYTRHTHIFGDKAAHSSADALKNWEDAKSREKSGNKAAKTQPNSVKNQLQNQENKTDSQPSLATLLAEIADKYKGLPAALRAQKTIQKLLKNDIITSEEISVKNLIQNNKKSITDTEIIDSDSNQSITKTERINKGTNQNVTEEKMINKGNNQSVTEEKMINKGNNQSEKPYNNLDFGKLLFDTIALCQINGIDAEVELNAYLNKLLNF